MAHGTRVAYHGGMDNFLVNNRPMEPKGWAIDAVVAVAAFLVGCGQLMLAASSIVIPDLAMRQYLGMVNVVPSASVFVALALTTLPLVVRRRFPWPVFLFTIVVFLGLQNAFGGFSLSVVGPVVAVYTIACELSRVEAVIAVVLAVVGLLFVEAPSRTASLAFFTRATNIALVAAAALGGYAYRTHRAYVEAVEQRAEEAERSREQEAARRVEEERVRIAREVHDITAHSLSAVSIQAAAAERLIDRDPAAAKEAIAAVRMTSKSALDDIRSMIGVLRHGDASADTAPTTGTDRLRDLIVYLRKAGIDAELDDTAYDRARVPAHVDVALFGIAREAATNIVRHACATHASISLALDGSRARLVVEDDGRGGRAGFDGEGREAGVVAKDEARRAQEALESETYGVREAIGGTAGGHGIEGMTERARLLGGALEAGARPGGGFRVAAVLPIGGGEGREA